MNGTTKDRIGQKAQWAAPTCRSSISRHLPRFTVLTGKSKTKKGWGCSVNAKNASKRK